MEILNYLQWIFLILGCICLIFDIWNFKKMTIRAAILLSAMMFYNSTIIYITNQWRITVGAVACLVSAISLLYVAFSNFKSRSNK